MSMLLETRMSEQYWSALAAVPERFSTGVLNPVSTRSTSRSRMSDGLGASLFSAQLLHQRCTHW